MTATAPPTTEYHPRPKLRLLASSAMPRSLLGILLHTYCGHLRHSVALYPACFTICQQLTYGRTTTRGLNFPDLRRFNAAFLVESKRTLKPEWASAAAYGLEIRESWLPTALARLLGVLLDCPLRRPTKRRRGDDEGSRDVPQFSAEVPARCTAALLVHFFQGAWPSAGSAYPAASASRVPIRRGGNADWPS